RQNIFDEPTVASTVQLASNEPAASGDSLAAVLAHQRSCDARADDALLSPAAQRLWFVEQLEPEHPFYNLPLAARINGLLDFPLLCQCINACVARHETLRSTYRVIDDQPRRHVADQVTLQPQLIDLRGDRHAAVNL